MRRPSLLTKFSLLSLLVIVALGLGVGSMLHERIERRALLEATKLAETMTSLGLQPILLPGDLAAGKGESHLDSLDEQLKLRDFDQLGIRRLKVFNGDGVIVYSDERSIVGETHPDSPVHPGRARGPHRSQRQGDELRRRRRPPLARGLRAAAARRRGRAERRRRGLPPVRAGGGRRSPRTPAASTCCSRSACCCSTRRCSGSSPSPRARCATRRCTTTSPTCPTARCSTTAWRTRWRPPSAPASRPRCC